MVLFIIGSRSNFYDYCYDYRVSPKESRGQTVFIDEGYRLNSRIMTPSDKLIRLDGWQDRSGAAELWYDVHVLEARSHGR